MAERDAKYKEMGLTNQAYIIAVGEENVAPDYYLVVLDRILYRLDNLIKAVDVAFKIQFVLNVEYAKECSLVWLFFQKYFYKTLT